MAASAVSAVAHSSGEPTSIPRRQSSTANMVTKDGANVGAKQGDQIGRIFAHWVIVYLLWTVF
jgi:hypothetical protein